MQIRSALVPCLMIALGGGLGLTGCRPDAPGGTTPPGESSNSDGDGGGQEGGDTADGGGGGEEGGGDAGAAPVKECDAQVADKPTPLFNHPESGEPQAFIRTPVSVELIEQSPTFYQTMSSAGFVSTCDAIVKTMRALIYLDDPAKNAEAFGRELITTLEQQGYANPQIGTPEVSEANKFRVAVDYDASGGNPAVRMYVAVAKGFGKVVIVLYETTQEEWPGLHKSFQESANRLILVPPAGG